MNEPRVVESVTNECQSLGRAHESSSARAEQLIACLEGEIAKRDARIVELEQQVIGMRLDVITQVDAHAVTRAELAALKAQEPVAELLRGQSAIGTWFDLNVFDQTVPNGTILYAAPVSEAKAQGVEQVQWHVRYLQAETVSDGWWQDSSEQRAAWCAEANQQQHAKGLPDTWEIRRFTIAAPVQQVSVPDEREAFEKWGETLFYSACFERHESDEYVGRGLQGAWLGWQARAMLAAPAAQAADAWIPVSERLPNIAQEVIVHSEFDGVCAGVLDSYGEWFAPCSEYKLIRVTSWMPMPTKIEANRHDQ